MELNGEQMARFRVSGKGNINHNSAVFSSDEILERRSFMRKVLKSTQFRNCNNDDLDGIRLLKLDDTGGYLLEDVNGREFYLQSSKISDSEVGYIRLRSMIPKEYANVMGKDFKWELYEKDITDIKNTVNTYISNYERFCAKGMGLYIYSKEKGSGKTRLACSALNEISKRYAGSIKFVNAMDFLEMTKKGFNYDNPDVEALYMCKTLVIDDIGVQMDKEWVNTVFYRLINNRYCDHKATIYTSNVPCEDLKMYNRTIDRIESTSFMIHLPDVPIRRMLSEREKRKMLQNENAP